MIRYLILFLFFGAATVEAANKRVFTCEPEWAALVRQLDPTAEVVSGTSQMQDPHTIAAKPSLIAGARRADFLVCSGADLEAGWLPVLLAKTGKTEADVIFAADYVQMLDIPAVLDRALGDAHPNGNPHVHLNPHNIAKVAVPVAARLGVSADDFLARWSLAITEWEKAALSAGLKGRRAITIHTNMRYFLDWLGIAQVATIEPKPGVGPSAAHLAELAKIKADVIIWAPYENPDVAKWLSDKTGIPARQAPFTGDDLFELFDKMIEAVK